MRACLVSVLPALIFALPAAANAQDGDTASQGLTLTVHAGAGAADAPGPDGSPFAVAAIGESELGAIAGREDTTQISQNEQFAGVANNNVGDNAVTGDARISDNAFQNMSGLSIMNVNTGNNVAINAAMNVNVSITSAP